MKISVLTMFPKMFSGLFENPLIQRALKSNVLELSIVDIKDHTNGSFRDIDDSPYGGGKGMILRVDAMCNALAAVKDNKSHVVLFSPKGKTLNQQKVKEFSKSEDLILVCGHYEGIDVRFESYVDETVSIGDFILSGGENAAITLCDSIVRLLPGVLKDGCSQEESFENNLLEYCQYTHPFEFNGQKVPEVLLSGNDKEIELFRQASSIMETAKYRPDLLEKTAEKDSVGRSADSILLFDNLVLKNSDDLCALKEEFVRYKWLRNKVKTPRIFDFYQSSSSILLMERIKDSMLCSDYFFSRPNLLIRTMADILKSFWSVDITDCPFESSPDAKLKMAKQNIESKKAVINPDFGFKSPEELYDWLCENKPSDYEKVFSHGDACLANFFVSRKGKVTVIDVGLCGVGDKYCDLAIAFRSLKYNAQGKYSDGEKKFDFSEDVFFKELGISPDWDRIRWYTLLDELF